MPGLGPKTAAALWKKLRVRDVSSLEEACRSGRILDLPRMGRRRAESILEALEGNRAREGRIPLHRAIAQAERFLGILRSVPEVVAAEAAGSVRRRRETVGDLDLLVATLDPDPAVRAFTKAGDVATVLAQGPTRCTVRLRGGLQVDLRVVSPSSFGAALHYFTGSKTHNITLRTRAVRLGLKLNEYGVFDRRGRRLGGEREEEVFRAVGLPFIPPELREGAGEIEAAEKGRLPRLLEEEDLQGDLHVHSRASSDARSTLPSNSSPRPTAGTQLPGHHRHSRSRPLGLDDQRLARQAAAIRALDRRHRRPRPAHRGRGRHPPTGGLTVSRDPGRSRLRGGLRALALRGFGGAHHTVGDGPALRRRSSARPSQRPTIGHRDAYAFDLLRGLRSRAGDGERPWS